MIGTGESLFIFLFEAWSVVGCTVRAFCTAVAKFSSLAIFLSREFLVLIFILEFKGFLLVKLFILILFLVL